MKDAINKITYVLDEKDDGTIDRIKNSEEIHMWIAENNKEVLTSARKTPPASTKFREVFGDYGEKDAAMKVINGTSHPSEYEISEKLCKILRHLKRPVVNQKVRTVDTEVSEEEYCELFERMCESTESSPSGIHVSHYKIA